MRARGWLEAIALEARSRPSWPFEADYASPVAYSAAAGRRQILDELAAAAEELGAAVASLSEAYELLDERTAERVEEELFRPAQRAYGRARATHGAFAERHGLPPREFRPAGRGAPGHGVRGFIDDAVDAVAAADRRLATLQDSLLPVEVGDPELRAGLEQVRAIVGDFPRRARELTRTLGR